MHVAGNLVRSYRLRSVGIYGWQFRTYLSLYKVSEPQWCPIRLLKERVKRLNFGVLEGEYPGR